MTSFKSDCTYTLWIMLVSLTCRTLVHMEAQACVAPGGSNKSLTQLILLELDNITVMFMHRAGVRM